MRRPRDRWHGRATALAIACTSVLGITACEFDEHAVGTGTARPVVHAVLNPVTPQGDYVVLLEHTLTGSVDTRADVHDPEDPIASGNGVPISGARVEITRTDGTRTAFAIEDASARSDHKGAGVYRFLNQPCTPFFCPQNAQVITRGGHYRLRITLPGATTSTIEGETTVPVTQPLANPSLRIRFDRERDTLRLTWPAAEHAYRYVLQIQTPYGPFQAFSDTNAILLSGGLRNFLSDRLPLVFTPGFEQAVQIAAVDTGYYDYYRTINDPFTGSGLLSNVRGATGLFGSYAPIRRDTLEVTAPQDEAVEGTFIGANGRFVLYAQGAEFVSGRWEDGAGQRHGVLGLRTGNRMRLAVLQAAAINDTLLVANGEVVADTLFVQFGGPGSAQRFRRAP